MSSAALATATVFERLGRRAAAPAWKMITLIVVGALTVLGGVMGWTLGSCACRR